MELAFGILVMLVPLVVLGWIVRLATTVVDGMRSINRGVQDVLTVVQRMERRQELDTSG